MAQTIEQKKRQKILIGILIVVIIITIFFWYSNYQKGSSYEAGSAQEGVAVTSSFEQRFKEIKLDLSILDDSLFKSLKSHGVLPVTVEEAGRKNPFVSY